MGGLFSPATLEQIRGANDIAEVIGSYLPLKRAGANFVALCPFHKEKTPSFNVNPAKQIFHCFGCHKGGDVFKFLQEYENLTFPEAVRRLAERARIPLEFEADDGQRQQRSVKDALLQIHESITVRWQAALANDAGGQIARDYLRRRGVPDEAVQAFRLGYAPEAWDDTVNWARSKGYEPALVEQAGLIIRKEETGHYYDRFRGRLIFPICDEQGRVIGFSGRVLSGDEKTAKYVNSPETPIFSKGRVFYGLDKAKRALLEAGRAVICEGQLDLIACHMAGVRHVVAPQGTAFTADHARILKRYVDEVILCFDADTAGRSAAVRVQDSLLASGLAVRVALLPAPHDPDSFIKASGAAAFQTLLAQSREFLDFYLEHLCATHDVATDGGQRSVVRAMAAMVQKTSDLVLADKYAQKTAMKLAAFMKLPISAAAVRAEFQKSHAPRDGATDPAEEAAPEPDGAAAASPREIWLLRLLLQDDACVGFLHQHLDPDWIDTAAVRDIIQRRLGMQEDRAWCGFAPFLAGMEDPSVKALIIRAVNASLEEDHFKGRAIPRVLDQARDLALFFRNQQIDRKCAELNRRLSDPSTPETERAQLARDRVELSRTKKAPLTPLRP